MAELVVNEVVIRRDAEGRYSLNDLHRASGKAMKNRPTMWLSSMQAGELVDELTCGPFAGRENRPLRVNHGGPTSGPFASQPLLLAYAQWISPAFYKKVNAAIGALGQGPETATAAPARQEGFDGAPRGPLMSISHAPTETALTVADVGVRRDAEGRYCLNDLHRAAGGEKRHAPNEWLRNRQTQELVREIAKPGIPGLAVIKGGNAPGTYVAKELVYAYATWVSPTFHLKVIRAYDALVSGQSVNPANLSRMQLLEMAMQAEREKEALTHQVEELAPKALALERIADSDGLFNITAAAKILAMRPRDLFAWLSRLRWIYRRPGGNRWLAYQERLQAGYLEHKVYVLEGKDGHERTEAQVLVTPKGLAKLADLLNRTPQTNGGSH